MKILTIEHIRTLSLNELINLYKEGYRLDEQVYPNINDVIPYSKNNKYEFTST